MAMTVQFAASLLLAICTTIEAQECQRGCIHYTSTGTISCSGLSSFPEFPNISVHILDIHQSNLPEIPSNALSKLSGLHSISIHNSTIGRIKNCAFNYLDLELLSINQSNIETIESGAFRNISFGGVSGKFEIQNVTIKTIESYAFMAIYGGRHEPFMFDNVNITKIKPAAFYDFYVTSFSFNSSYIKHIRTTAILKFRIEKIEIIDTYIERLDCGTFYRGFSTEFSIDLEVNCDCNIAWMLAGNYITQFNNTKCREPDHLSGMYLALLNVTQVCPLGMYTKICDIREYAHPVTCPAVDEDAVKSSSPIILTADVNCTMAHVTGHQDTGSTVTLPNNVNSAHVTAHSDPVSTVAVMCVSVLITSFSHG